MTTRQFPAFRINPGDVVTVERRRYRVGRVDLVARFSRSRDVAPMDPLVRFTLWPVRGGNSRTAQFGQYELVRVAR